MKGLIFFLLVGVPLLCTAQFSENNGNTNSLAFGVTEDVQIEDVQIRSTLVGVKIRTSRLLNNDGNHDPEATAAAAVAEAMDEVLENPTMSPVKNCKSAKDCPTEVETITSPPVVATLPTLSPVKNCKSAKDCPTEVETITSPPAVETLPTLSPVKNCKSAKDCPTDANDEIDFSQIEGFVLNEACLAVIGETMFSTNVTSSTNLLPEDIPRPTLESEDSEVQDVWLSCMTPSGMVFDIDGADHEWMIEVLQKKKLESGDTFLIAPDKCRVGAVDQKLLVPKSALKFAKAPKSEKSGKSDKSDSRRKLKKGSSKTSRRGLKLTSSPVISERNEKDSRRLLREERSVLVVRVVLADAEPSNTVQELSNSVFGNNVDSVNLASQFNACSYGQMSFVKAMDRSGLTSSIDNGATTVTIPYSKTSHHGLIRNKITQELNYQFGVGNPRELADHVMYCLPPGSMPAVAYGIINSHLTVFLDRWCTYVSAQMHEIGHNLGWGHSGTIESQYNDMSGIMGYSFAQSDGPKLCTNGAKFWKTNWYGNRYHIINDVSLDKELRSFNYTGTLASFNNDPLVDGPPMIIKVATDTNMTYFVGYNGMMESNSGATSLDTVNIYSVEDEEMYGSGSILHATLSAGETFHASIGISLNVTVLSIDEVAGEAMIDISSSTTVITRGSFEVWVEGTCNVTDVEESLLSSLIETDPESSFEVMSAQPHCVSRRNLQEESIAAQNFVLVTLNFSHKFKFGRDKKLKEKREVVDKYKEKKKDIDAKLKEKFKGAGSILLKHIDYFDRTTSVPSMDVSSAPSSSPTRSGNCLDSPEGWHDADGEMYNCDWYGVGDRCTTWGASSNFNTTANEACCSCGGGRILDTSLSLSSTSSPSNIPSHQISLNPSKIPSHIPSIKPSFGPTSRPTATPSSKPSVASSLSPTRIASSSPSIPLSNRQFNVGSVCNDKMEGWFDVDGGAYTCEWYSQNGRCQQYGHGSANFGLTANECCCSCGGGDIVSSSNHEESPATPPSSSGSAETSCNDKYDGWYDADGAAYDCQWYGNGSNCQTYGDGSANFGFTANEACCSCGGGDIVSSGSNQGSPSPPLPSSQGNSPSSSSGSGSTPGSVCNDKMEGWFDVDGGAYTCEWYSQNGRCQQYGHGSANFGLTANECCCSCGGGDIVSSSNHEESPATPPSSSGSAETSCNDKYDGWYDADGAAYDCQWYGNGSNCQTYGDGSANFGFTANEACCSCGGGDIVSSGSNQGSLSPPSPSSQGNSQSSSSGSGPTPGSVCNDKMEGWFDVDGGAYTCEWYSQNGRCQQYGHGSANFGLTANECCCSCGGGDIVSSGSNQGSPSPPSSSQGSSPSSSSGSVCNDKMEGWFDVDGGAYNCQWYSNGSNCQQYGHGSDNFGLTANEACCSCGGGDIVSSSNHEESSATPPSSGSADSSCNDKYEGWYDADGAAYDCQWYGNGSNCQTYGDGSANFGLTANECCCSCGGGDIVTNASNQGSPSGSPPSPSSQGNSQSSSSGSGSTPGSVCNDKMAGWFDVDGGAYTCEWYSHSGRCQQYGHGSANFGLTANECCCSCGGGTMSS